MTTGGKLNGCHCQAGPCSFAMPAVRVRHLRPPPNPHRQVLFRRRKSATEVPVSAVCMTRHSTVWACLALSRPSLTESSLTMMESCYCRYRPDRLRGGSVTLADYLRLLRQHWLSALLTSLLVAVGALGYSLALTPLYRAKSQIFVSTQASGDIADLTQGSSFTEKRVKSYTDLVTSPRLLQPVIDALHLPMTTESLAEEVVATSPLDTVLIDITVTDPYPTRARDIANAIADTYPKFVAELETPPHEARSPVNVSRTQPAITPATPVSPQTRLNVMFGLLVGLGLGMGLAVLRESMDKSIKSREQAQLLAQAPVMTAVGDDLKATDHQLITYDAFSPRAEAFRQLRTNIRFLSVDHRVSSLVVTSAVAGEGKSTTAANLAIALAQAGESVVLIDADLRRPTLADVFTLSSGIGLTSVLVGDLSVDDALQRWRDDLPLHVLTAGRIPPNPAELIGSARMAMLIEDLTRRGATVVLDSPPLLPVTDAALLARATDVALIVTRAALTHSYQLAAACSAVRIGLSIRPIALTSLKSVAQARLVSASGGPGRNWSGLRSISGRTLATQGVSGDWPTGSSQTPGPGAGMLKPTSASRPSPCRRAMIPAAAACPTAIPASLSSPSGTAARAAA